MLLNFTGLMCYIWMLKKTTLWNGNVLLPISWEACLRHLIIVVPITVDKFRAPRIPFTSHACSSLWWQRFSYTRGSFEKICIPCQATWSAGDSHSVSVFLLAGVIITIVNRFYLLEENQRCCRILSVWCCWLLLLVIGIKRGKSHFYLWFSDDFKYSNWMDGWIWPLVGIFLE